MIKKIIKKVLSKEKIDKLKAYKNYFISMPYSISKKNRIEILNDDIIKYSEIENPNGHIFCGYFDISPDNPFNSEEILVGMLDKKAKTGKDSLTIAITNLSNGKIEKISETKAWNWQMGSRIRWSNTENIIYYNDFYDNNYCCNIFDIKKRKILRRIPYALYDISKDEIFGLTVNFDRLQRLRPGYGYSNLEDITKNENTPNNDGLFIVDIDTGERKLLVSYQQLSDLMPDSKNRQCYINHISISPNNKKAMFFFIWLVDEKPGWKATLWTIDLKTKEVKCLEKKYQVSHYAWKDNNTLIITGVDMSNKTCFYRLYDSDNNNYVELDNENLKKDGHPTFSRQFNGFYSDTYPDKKFRQLLFKYENNDYIPLVKVFHNPKMYGEKRCDLHPHYFCTQESVAIDTIFDKNKRKIIVLRMKENE